MLVLYLCPVTLASTAYQISWSINPPTRASASTSSASVTLCDDFIIMLLLLLYTCVEVVGKKTI